MKKLAIFSILFSFCIMGGFFDVIAQTTERVSLDSVSIEGDANSLAPSISDDGRYVAFHSDATNLVANDTNSLTDVFVRDRQLGITTRVSVDSLGAEAIGGNSRFASISDDGRYVAFHSDATNLVANDVNGTRDVFLHDRQLGITRLVSMEMGGITGGNGVSSGASLSANGNFVVFESYASDLVSNDTNARRDIFLYNVQTQLISRVSLDSMGNQSNSDSGAASISESGRYVAFHSDATNLVANDTNGVFDVFIHEVQTTTTTRISVDSQSTEGDNNSVGPEISADGRYIAFYSSATNLVPNDTNGFIDIFLHDRQLGSTTRVSVSTQGAQANNDSIAYVTISSDGRFVLFESDASNLVTNDTNNDLDIFIYDTQNMEMFRISVASQGGESNGNSYAPDISQDNEYIAFYSDATNLVANDTNVASDIFVHEFSSYIANNSNGNQGSVTRRRTVGLNKEKDPSGNSCPYFYEYLRFHDKDTSKGGLKQQVAMLQEFLVHQGFEVLMPVDGIFGLLTKKAVTAWQNHYAQEILWPWSLFTNKKSSAQGYFYKTSRRWANMQKGCPESVTLDNGVVLPADSTKLKVFY